jgi:ATP-binding cassette subfamily G (WHITE) protein 2 (SNQ2)
LDLLDLTHIQDAIIGTPSAGLNPEQRKRTTIAVEVVSRPRLLYLDEPTTGLDTKSALRVVQLLRRLARTGLAIICTIHQPVRFDERVSLENLSNACSMHLQSSETFDVFDDLLLLQRGGKQVYFGPREAAVGYFTETGSTNEHVNPADFLLDVAGAGIDTPDDELVRTADLDVLSTRWKASNAYRALQSELEILSSPDSFDSRAKASAASIWTQCVELTKRVSRHYWRDPSFSYTKLFTSTVVPLVVGLSFFQVGRESTLVSFQNRMFSVFLLLFVPVVWLVSSFGALPVSIVAF